MNPLRIGTWNLENQLMTDDHKKLILDQKCDVWLLTELHRSWADDSGTKVLHFHSHLSQGVMGRKQHWAAILSLDEIEPLGDPHPASAAAIDALFCKLPKSQLVWGGDWNHSLIGRDRAGSMEGREHLLAAITMLGLNVPTSVLSHRGDYCTAIDHIGVPLSWAVDRAYRIDANGLSDHDAYVVEVSWPS